MRASAFSITWYTAFSRYSLAYITGSKWLRPSWNK